MSGQGSYGGGEEATSSAAGCALREGRAVLPGSPANGIRSQQQQQQGAILPTQPSSSSNSSFKCTSTAGESTSTLSWIASNTTNSNSNEELACFLWGRGEDGQLGIGDTSDQESPTYVDSLRGVGIHQIACGSGHTVVLTREGDVYTWGRGDDGRLGHGDNGWKYVPRIISSFVGVRISQITCGSYHTAAVDAVQGDLYTWGGGMYGKLGHGNESGHATPKLVKGLEGIPIRQIACGSRHTAVVTSTGTLYTWGDKENGVTGHYASDTNATDTNGGAHQSTPKLLDRFRGRRILQLSACGFHTGCIVAADDEHEDNETTIHKEVYTWGEGKFGRLGHNQERNCLFPRLLEALSREHFKNPKQIACGGFHTAVVTDDGCVYTFGGGEHGQLGHGDKINKLKPTLVQALETSRITQITCGWSHSVALSEDGKVWTWGNGDHGKLGLGNGRKYSTPQLVDKLSPFRVVKIASYNEHTAALVDPYDECGNLRTNSGIQLFSSYPAGRGNGGVTPTFLQDLRSMVNDDEFSDVTFVVSGHRIHAHRAILAKRCEHFAAMFRSGMRESLEREICIPNIPSSIFKLMLEFLYTDGVKINIDIEQAVDLYVAADLYQLDRLKEMCSFVVKRNMNVTNVTYLINEASSAHCQTLKDICMEFMIANFEVLSKREEIKILSHSLLLELLAKRP